MENKKIEKTKTNSKMPSRMEIHGVKKQKKKKRKLRVPLIKVLAVFFVILVVGSLAVYSSISKGDSADAGGSSQKEVAKDTEVVIDELDEDEEETAGTKKDTEKDAQADEGQEAKKEANTEETSEQDKNKDQAAVSDVKPTEKEEEKTAEKTNEKADSSNSSSTNTEKEQSTSKTEEKKETEPSGPKVVEHTVQSKETIFRIAMNYYGSQKGIEIIKNYNGLNGNDLRVGQVLKIPLEQ
ncbi:MAG: LysM peptidoglycan-binding domain-containing protein [Bacillus sp. (in: firmicutes)]